FTIGLAPWEFRNWKTFNAIVPIVDSVYLNLWVGNNPRSTGGPQLEQAVLETLADARGEDPKQTLEELGQLAQKDRYDGLGTLVLKQIRSDPAAAVKHRFEAGAAFLLGESWLKDRVFWRVSEQDAGKFPEWLESAYPALLSGGLLLILLFGLLGWRWSFAWQAQAMPSSLAFVWIPLPYILGHAEFLSGARLPLDGIFLTYTAVAIACLLSPGWQSLPESKEGHEQKSR